MTSLAIHTASVNRVPAPSACNTVVCPAVFDLHGSAPLRLNLPCKIDGAFGLRPCHFPSGANFFNYFTGR